MSWDQSDVEIHVKYDELSTIIQNISEQKRAVTILLQAINSLKMKDYAIYDERGQTQIGYSLPKNIAGDEMDRDYRISQKVKLLVNIQKFLDDYNN